MVYKIVFLLSAVFIFSAQASASCHYANTHQVQIKYIGPNIRGWMKAHEFCRNQQKCYRAYDYTQESEGQNKLGTEIKMIMSIKCSNKDFGIFAGRSRRALIRSMGENKIPVAEANQKEYLTFEESRALKLRPQPIQVKSLK